MVDDTRLRAPLSIRVINGFLEPELLSWCHLAPRLIVVVVSIPIIGIGEATDKVQILPRYLELRAIQLKIKHIAFVMPIGRKKLICQSPVSGIWSRDKLPQTNAFGQRLDLG
jgi:hypothetical protein